MQIGEHCRDKFVSAQTLGEANERVALDLMGLRQEEFDALVSERIFSNRPDKAVEESETPALAVCSLVSHDDSKPETRISITRAARRRT